MAQIWGVKNSNLSYEDYDKGSKWWNWSIRIMNLATIIGLFVGALFLLFFIKTNL